MSAFNDSIEKLLYHPRKHMLGQGSEKEKIYEVEERLDKTLLLLSDLYDRVKKLEEENV